MQLIGKLHINGARGLTLLGFSMVSLLFGVGFFFGSWLGPLMIWPPPPQGLTLLSVLGGLRFWGGLWIVVGGFLFIGAFRQDQSRAMGGFAFMCFIWGSSYGWTFIGDLIAHGRSPFWLSSAAFFALLVACLGVARMLNAPPLNIEGLRRLDPPAEGALKNDD